MDRFIVYAAIVEIMLFVGLKSNMDRFIADEEIDKHIVFLVFKIQYG